MKNIIEIWKPVVGYEGLYEVSDLGRVRSLNYHRSGKVRVLKYKTDKDGYKFVILCKDGKYKSFRVHRLVALAFIPNPDNLPCINHKDENKTNNCVENLEWCTRRYNVEYSLAKPVNQYTLDGILVREWPSTNEVERQTGWSCGNISKCCNNKRKTAHGFIWRYSE